VNLEEKRFQEPFQIASRRAASLPGGGGRSPGTEEEVTAIRLENKVTGEV
jgi:hypothetical protein